MVGFYAYAKSLEIDVEKEELEDAKWHTREDVKKALTFAVYKKAQKTTATKVDQMCKGVEKGQNLFADYTVEIGELATLFISGPFAITQHLISSWANQVDDNGDGAQMKQAGNSF
ncbi:nudix hydrolase 19, chloroplastic-like [Olea europaea var. sylvestris]|uniref:nudix hydrolase 19, chloroplastic-like n=1 Tax=Olea europaea var. sylvestris TaxID=158386 RepID=UPI000C1CFD26|nr:nudix hydrolase 19, chloroplastic-like [Olea europaea var. sylvestris]